MKFETPIMNIMMYGRENVVTASPADVNDIKGYVEGGTLTIDGESGPNTKIMTVVL